MSQPHTEEEAVAREIADKLGYSSGVSYREIAEKASEFGKNKLAIKVSLGAPKLINSTTQYWRFAAVGLWIKSKRASGTFIEITGKQISFAQSHRKRRHRFGLHGCVEIARYNAFRRFQGAVPFIPNIRLVLKCVFPG